MRINELRQHLVQYDMIEVFSILQFPPYFNGELLHPLPDKIYFLSKWDSLSEDTLHAHIRFLRRHGQDWDLQNLDWSHEFIHDSCDVDLSNEVQEDLLGISSELECGPLYFYFMMNRIISSSEDAVIALIDKVKDMNIINFKCENITMTTGQLKLAVKRLTILGKVQADIMIIM